MPEPPSVAFLVDGHERYGIGTVVTTLAEGLAARGGKPVVLSFGEGDLVDACRERGWVTKVLGLESPPHLVLKPAALLKSLRAQRRLHRKASQILPQQLKETGSSHLVAQTPTHLTVAGAAAKQARARCWWMMPNIIGDNWPLGINRRLYQHLIRKYGIIPLPNSHYTARTLGEEFVDNTVYLGADTHRFSPSRVEGATRAELGIPEGRVVFGIFSRLIGHKGQVEFWEALLRWIDRGEDVALLLVGGPTDNEAGEKIRELERRHQASDKLYMTGWTTEPEHYYPLIDIAVNSRIDPEPFGLSVIEAMLMEKPILVHALGGPTETVLDGETGWHVNAPSVSSFEQGIGRTLADRQKWVEMGRFAREHALVNYSTEALVERFLARIEAS